MIKSWSPAITTLVFEHLNVIWTTKFIPLWMKDKLIRLIPKSPGTTDLNNMRPISLYETLRKIMTTIIARRIHLIWHNSHLLNTNQYGYRLHSGINMPLYNILNHIEMAHTQGVPTIITFWDIKRAFDSIPRNLQKLAWVRLGLSIEDATWFVDLDDGGHSFLITPFFEQSAKIMSSTNLLQNASHFHSSLNDLTFTSQRGIGQGESASSLVWVAVYDILLDLLQSITEKNGSLNAYADDLASVTTGPNSFENHQKIAQLISAFCAFTGMQLNYKKIIPVLLGHSGIRSPTASLQLFDHHWKSIPCLLQRNPTNITYLGVLLDYYISNDHQKNFNALFKLTNTLITKLLDQPGSPTVKINYIRFKIFPIILSRAACGNWSLSEYRKLDKPFTRAYRLLLANPQKFPDALHYLPHKYGGIELPRLSDHVQLTKWKILLRSDIRGGFAQKSAQKLLLRLPHDTSSQDENILTTISIPLDKHFKPLLTLSLAQWLTESNLQMVKSNPPSLNDSSISNKNTLNILQDFAQQVQKIFKEDHINSDDTFTNKNIFCISTDGSFHPHHDTLQSSFQDKPPQNSGTGSASIVIFPTTSNIKPLALRISQPSSLPGLSPFLWELFAQTTAIKLVSLLQFQTNIISDCKAAVARTNEILCSTSLNPTNDGSTTLLLSTHNNRPIPNTSLTWYPSHPERHYDRRNNPSPYDKAIYIADKVADHPVLSCVLGPYNTQVNTISTISTDVLSTILPINQWYICPKNDTTFPIFTDYLTYQHHYQQRKFLENRDKDTKFYKFSYWQSTYFNLANSLRPLKSYSFWKAARRTQIWFDWVAHGRQRAKMELNSQKQAQLLKCILCGQNDKQEHIIFDCSHCSLTTTRSTILKSIKRTAKPFLESKNPQIKKFTEKFLQYTTRTHSTFTRRLWLGLWSQELLEILCRDIIPKNERFSAFQILEIKSIIRSLSRPLWRGYIKLIKIAQKAQGLLKPHIKLNSIITSLHPTHQRHLSTAFLSEKDFHGNIIPSLSNTNDNRLDITNVAFVLPISNSNSSEYESDSDS